MKPQIDLEFKQLLPGGSAGHTASITEVGHLASVAVRGRSETRPVAARTSKPFEEEVPALLEERGISLRALGRAAGVGDDHLSRVIRGARGKRATPGLARRVALALDLPEDYFVEARLDFVIEQLADRTELLDEVYDLVRRRRRRRR
ncbi:MAG: helix-turn-helix domain-containing protein [Acidimicrobiales bacterium]